MEKKTLGIFGCGSLGTLIAEAVKDGYLEEYRLVGVTDVAEKPAKDLAEKVSCRACEDLDALLDLKPDFLIEAAAPDALAAVGEKILMAGSDLIALSVGALADESVYEALEAAAKKSGRKIYLSSGALGGFDVMTTAALMGPVKCTVVNEKAPEALNGAPFLQGRILPEDREEEIFRGSALDAIKVFPKNVNVAVAASLATAGPKNTLVTVVSKPGMTVNRHRVEVEGEEVEISITIDSKPSKANPKSSAMAAWSVVMLLKKLSSPVLFG